MSRSAPPPAYRRKRVSGVEYAYVTLTDANTGTRRDVCLGRYGSEESRQRYVRLLSDWEARGRQVPDVGRRSQVGDGPTVSQLCLAYWADKTEQCGMRHLSKISMAIRILREYHGSDLAASLGPNALRRVRREMVKGNPKAKPRPRKPWKRATANQLTRCIISIFKWGVSHELVSAQVYETLRTLEPLRPGESGALDSQPIRPIPDEYVDAVLPYLRPQVHDMVELQRMTGMRPGEVIIMRTCDLDTTGRIWTYTPARHKTQHHGHRRVVHIGPRGQKTLEPWLRPVLEEYLFQPREAVADQLAERHEARETPLKYGNRPGTNRKTNPRRNAGDHYDTCSYRRAITRACDQADEAARKKAKKDERLIPRWHPNQLRHNHATAVRREFGAEAAQIALGHQNLRVTEIYAERDQAVAERVAKALG